MKSIALTAAVLALSATAAHAVEARTDEIADRIAHERTGAARERTSTHEAQRPSH
jgi:hypothetical protein